MAEIRVIREVEAESVVRVPVQASTGRRAVLQLTFEDSNPPAWIELRDMGVALVNYANAKMPAPPAMAVPEDDDDSEVPIELPAATPDDD